LEQIFDAHDVGPFVNDIEYRLEEFAFTFIFSTDFFAGVEEDSDGTAQLAVSALVLVEDVQLYVVVTAVHCVLAGGVDVEQHRVKQLLLAVVQVQDEFTHREVGQVVGQLEVFIFGSIVLVAISVQLHLVRVSNFDRV